MVNKGRSKPSIFTGDFGQNFFNKPTPGSQTLKSDPTKFDVNSL